MFRLRQFSGLAALALSLAALSGCGSASESSAPPAGRLVHARGLPAGMILLSAAGAQHIGLQLATAQATGGGAPVVGAKPPAATPAGSRPAAPAPKPAANPMVIVPAGAIVYDATGKTYAFTRLRPLAYTEVPVQVDHIAGPNAFLRSGPKAGSQVVSTGAEELFGVQTGVLAQT